MSDGPLFERVEILTHIEDDGHIVFWTYVAASGRRYYCKTERLTLGHSYRIMYAKEPEIDNPRIVMAWDLGEPV